MTTRILVAYATKYGSTQQVAETIVYEKCRIAASRTSLIPRFTSTQTSQRDDAG